MSITNSPDSLTWIDQAKAYLQQDQYIDALNCVHQGLAVAPRNPEAWLQCGSVLQQLGFYGQAITANHNAQRLFSNPGAGLKSIPLDTLLASVQGQATNDESSSVTSARVPVASSSSDVALQMTPADYDFWWKRAQACTQRGDLAAALSAYDKVLECRPNQAQAWYRRGLVLFYLQKHNDAIASFEQATEYQPDLYQAWNNRASILFQLGNFEEAIVNYDQALSWTDGQLWQAWDDRGMAIFHAQGLDAGLAAWQEGIQALSHNADEYQFGCGSLHQRQGDMQAQQAWQQTSPQSTWRAAKLSYLKALDLLNFQTFPEQHLEIWQSLLQVRFHLHETTAIHTMLLEAAIKLQTLAQNPKFTSEQCLQLEQRFAGFQHMQVDELILQNRLKEAVLWAERYKNQSLGRWRRGPDYEAAQLQYSDIQPLLNPQRAIVFWHDSPAAVSTFILKHDQEPTLLFTNPTLSKDLSQDEITASPIVQRYRLQAWLRNWQKSQQSSLTNPSPANGNAAFWLRGQAVQQLARLDEILAIRKLCETVLSEVQEVVLIVPPRWRSLPLQFLFPEQFSLTLLPSLQIGLNLLNDQSVQKDYLLSLMPSTGFSPRKQDSKLAALETFAISQSYRQQIQLSGPHLTQKTVMAALKVSGGRVHFTGMVEQDGQQPENTGMVLMPQSRLSLSDLKGLNWQSYSMVCLAGGSKFLEQPSSPVTEVDLETVLVSAGVQHVISSLWTVNHFSRVLLMAHVHELLAQNCNPVHALKQAQHWLRTLTYSEIIKWCSHFLERPDLDPEFATTLAEVKSQLQSIEDEGEENRNRFPYRHPWYWAGFIVVGNFPDIVVWSS